MNLQISGCLPLPCQLLPRRNHGQECPTSFISYKNSNKDHFPSLMLSRLCAVQPDYEKEQKFIHLKHCILFSSNAIFICILFSLMRMEMISMAHPVIAFFQQQRWLDLNVPFLHSHQGTLSLPACYLHLGYFQRQINIPGKLS